MTITMPTYSQSRGFFNGEFFQARTLIGGDAETSVFTDTERKLLTLALNSSATENESDVCAVKFVRSLRRRGITTEQFVRALSQRTLASRELSAARGRVITFGKHRGKSVGEVRPSYLDWALKNCRDMPYNVRCAMRLVLAASERCK